MTASCLKVVLEAFLNLNCIADHAKQSPRPLESRASPPDDIFSEKEATYNYAMETEHPFDEEANLRTAVNESFEEGELKDSLEEKRQVCAPSNGRT